MIIIKLENIKITAQENKNPSAENLFSGTPGLVPSVPLMLRLFLVGACPTGTYGGGRQPGEGGLHTGPYSVSLWTGLFLIRNPKQWLHDYASCSSCLGLNGWGHSHSECMPPHPTEPVNHIQPTNSGPPCNCYRALSISCSFLCLSSFGCILKTVRLPCFCKDLTIPASQCSLNWTSCCLNGAVCPSPRH